jgi:hypothetical protein
MSTESKPKPAPPPSLTRLAGDALVETIDGPVPVIKLVGKVIPVLTRFRDGALGFRMMREIRELVAEAPLLEIENADGQRVCVGVDHVFVRAGGGDVRAGAIVPGDRLDAGWTYPAGYEIPDAAEYQQELRGRTWDATVRVRALREVGRGPLYACSVGETKSYYLTFGARSRAQV